MAPCDDLAERLVEYDKDLAEAIFVLVCTQLGGPAAEGDPNVAKMREFMRDPAVARLRSLSELGDVETETTTAEWKSQFARSERLRTLGLALADRLAPRIGR